MSLNPSPFVTGAKVIYMMSFSRSEETLMQRHLNAHPDIQVGYALTDKEPKGLDRLFRDEKLEELPAAHCAQFGVRKKYVIGKSIWTHGEQSGFVLARHPFSVVASIVSNFNLIPRDRQQLFAVKVKKINRLCSYVDPRIADGLADTLSMDDVVLKVALAWSKRMSVAHASGDSVVLYEDFVANPREELEKLCAALDLPFHEDMLHAEKAYAEGEIGHGGIKLNKPISPEISYGKIRLLTDRQLDLVNMVCGDTMNKFGYEDVRAAQSKDVA